MHACHVGFEVRGQQVNLRKDDAHAGGLVVLQDRLLRREQLQRLRGGCRVTGGSGDEWRDRVVQFGSRGDQLCRRRVGRGQQAELLELLGDRLIAHSAGGRTDRSAE